MKREQESPSLWTGLAASFKEDIGVTIARERSFRLWSSRMPSRFKMMRAGWEQNAAKEAYSTKCRYCGVEYQHWKTNDDPQCIHDILSPLCPFRQASQPMSPSLVQVQTLQALSQTETTTDDLNIPASSLLETSRLPYALPPTRDNSFASFPGGSPNNKEALVRSGFYCTGVDKNVHCYHCRGRANDLHLYLPEEIDAQHRQRFPNCRFAQLLLREGDATSHREYYLFSSKLTSLRSTRCRFSVTVSDTTNFCHYCMTNEKDHVLCPCTHLAVCRNCASSVYTCPICGDVALSAFKVFQ